MKIALLPALAALALLSLLHGARADQIWGPGGPVGGVTPGTVVGSATSLGGGLYRYDYTITNLGSSPNGTLDDFTLLPQLKQWSDYFQPGSQSPFPPNLKFPMSSIQTSPTFPYSGHVDPSYGGMVWFGYPPMGGGLKSGQSGQVSFVVPFPPGVMYYMVTYTQNDPDGGSVGGVVDSVIGPDVSGGIDAATTPEPTSALLLALGGLGLAGSGWRRRKLSATA